MKKFLIKTLFWLSLLCCSHIILGAFADGNTDDNYMRFTSKGSNIIMGDSRGAQAVIPFILDEKFPGKTFDNFALNIAHSPYGEIYLKGLKRKLKNDTKDGIFILTVDPWNLSKTENEKELRDFVEYYSPLNDVHTYTKPNYEYLIKHYTRSWFKLFTEREDVGKSSTFLHKDGWMEVSVNMNADSVATRQVKKVEGYAENAKKLKISEYRLKSLEETIIFLKQHGTVYIVRIPASKEIMTIENKYWFQFNEKMKQISDKYKVRYFDFSENPSQYIYTDGNHMYKESGKILTTQIADSIILNQHLK